MVNWIFISIVGVVAIAGGATSHTIVYPGKSALLSYSPARGEFPVESLFGRGFFSYIDNQGISRTVNLEPNPLLGVRVSNDGNLSTDSDDTGSLRGTQKEDRLKPIKEFDERPFQDSLELNKESGDSKLVEGSQQTKGDQILSVTIPKEKEQIFLRPETETVLTQASGLQIDGNKYFPSQNVPLSFSSSPIASQPSVPGVLSLTNPFLKQQFEQPTQNPSQTNNLAAAQQSIPSSQLSGQVFLYPSTGSINSGDIPNSYNPVPQALPGQFLLFPQKIPTPGGVPVLSSNISPEINSAPLLLSKTNQGIPSDFNKLSATNDGITTSQGPAAVEGLSLSGQYPAINSQKAPISSSGQIVSLPSAVISPSSKLPGFDSKLASGIPNPAPVVTTGMQNLGILPGGNPFFNPSGYPISASPKEEVLMLQPANPFLSLDNKRETPLPLPTPTTTTPAPLFNTDLKNPFLTNSLGSDANLGVPSAQQQPIGNLPSTLLDTAKPVSTSCDYLSVGPVPEQIKDTPEVEKAKREHFLAHQLALEQLAQARQNSDNNDQGNESPLTLSSASDNAPLDQPVTSGPTTAFEQTTSTTVNNAESEISTLQALP